MRLGYAAGRKKELQHDAHRIAERIVTEALTPVFAPHDFWITVPDFEYNVMRWPEEKWVFRILSTKKKGRPHGRPFNFNDDWC